MTTVGKCFALALLLFAAGALGSCGPSKPDFDEDKMLSEIGFNLPIVAVVRPGQVIGWGGRPNTDDNAFLSATLAKAGYIKFIPNPDKAPWWNFTIAGDRLDGAWSTQIATRNITKRSDEKQWSEGAVDYFAETISYTIDSDPRVRDLLDPPARSTSHTLRLVLMNDPAIGKWQIATRGNDFTADDKAPLIRNLISQGRELQSEFLNAIGQAQVQAYDVIEKRLAEQGLVARGAVDGVLVSKSAGLAYYIVPEGAANTLRGLDELCRNLKLGNYSGWHWAMLHEVRKVTGGEKKNFLDAPDGRLWGAISQVQGRRISHVIEMDTFGDNCGKAFNFANLQGCPGTGIYWQQELTIHENGYGHFGHGARTARGILDAPSSGRALCAAPL